MRADARIITVIEKCGRGDTRMHLEDPGGLRRNIMRFEIKKDEGSGLFCWAVRTEDGTPLIVSKWFSDKSECLDNANEVSMALDFGIGEYLESI